MTPRQFFITSLWLGLAFKLLLAVLLPLTTDEAYFLIWARHLDYGFYDHPPMVGWWLAGLLSLADTDWWLRIPAVILSTLLGLFIYRILREGDSTRAYLVAAAFLLAPTSLYNIFIATDTPMILLGVLSAWVFYHAERRQRWDWFFYAGLLLGLSFLSKYFAALLGFAYLAYILVYRRNLRGLFAIGVVFLGVIPSLALNLYWNYQHCWDNVLFNFFNRHEQGSGFSTNLGLYLAMWLYLLTPAWFYYVFKNRRQLIQQGLASKLFFILSALPLLLFLLLTTVGQVGLHWVMAFYPFVFIASAGWFSLAQWRVITQWLVALSLVHIGLLLALALSPYSFVKSGSTTYNKVVMALEKEQLLEALEPYGDGYVLATTGYGTQAVMSYLSGDYYIVLGPGSHYGRQDDILTDFRQLDGRDMLIFTPRRDALQGYARYFEGFELKPLSIRGAQMEFALGRGFDYAAYRQQVLQGVKRYYQIPDFLPRGECYFYRRYFPEQMGGER